MDWIIHTEKEFVVCCKPVGVECEHELPALLANKLGGTAANFYCIHRLDRAVGGVMVYARSAAAAATLSEQVQQRSFTKEYLCVCSGSFENARGEMRDFLYKDSVKSKSFTVSSARRGIKEAVLNYSILAETEHSNNICSLAHVVLQTGRFHQIRCQFAARRHPLLGDGKYGSRERGCTVALWSHRICFTHPKSGETVSFSLIPPDTFPWNLFPSAILSNT